MQQPCIVVRKSSTMRLGQISEGLIFSELNVTKNYSNGARIKSVFFFQISYYNAQEARNETYAKYCGTKVPPMITINSNLASIRFSPGIEDYQKSFRLEWMLFGK